MHRYQLLLEQFDSILPNVRAVSFDVFDTLLVRTLHEPENLFDLMGHRLADPGFTDQRRLAQTQGFKQMAREGRKELTLADIYDNLPHEQFGAAVLSELEQALEHQVLRVNPEVLQLLLRAQQHGKILVLTSDMYLPQSFFETLCSRLALKFDHLFVSSACNCTKRDDGELFNLVKLRLGLAGEHILHIGDNPLGDVKRAREKGLHTLHYLAPGPNAADPVIALKNPSVSAYVCAGLARYATYQTTENPWIGLGWQYGGPLLHGFLDWIQLQARHEGIDRLLFVSRDGFLLQQLHQHYPRSPVAALYMRGSRVSFNMAALTERNFLETVTFLLSGADNITLAELFLRIGVELPDECVLGDLGLSAQTPISDDTRRPVTKFLIAMRFRILQVAREARRGLHRHLLDLGLEHGMRVAFVDVGWSGTTQQAFERALAGMLDLDVRGYYLGLSEPADTLSARTGLHLSAMSEAMQLDDKQRAVLYENRAVAELFFSAPHATTVGYRLGPDDSLEFVEDHERGLNYGIGPIVDSINQGIAGYVDDAEQLLNSLAIPIEHHLPLHNLLQLLSQPSPQQAALIGRIYNWDAWASSEGYRIYFAGKPDEAGYHFKPDLWPAGWQVARTLTKEQLGEWTFPYPGHAYSPVANSDSLDLSAEPIAK